MDSVIIVAGFGRCGSSLVMQMLHAGGMPCVGESPAFEPRASFSVDISADFLRSNAGKAIKILDPHMAPHGAFKGLARAIIWLDRDPVEQAKSFIKFGRIVAQMPFTNRDIPGLVKGLKKDRPQALRALGVDQCPTQPMQFEHILSDPQYAAFMLAEFLGDVPFDQAKAAAVVRKRAVTCLPGLLEPELVEGF